MIRQTLRSGFSLRRRLRQASFSWCSLPARTAGRRARSCTRTFASAPPANISAWSALTARSRKSSPLVRNTRTPASASSGTRTSSCPRPRPAPATAPECSASSRTRSSIRTAASSRTPSASPSPAPRLAPRFGSRPMAACPHRARLPRLATPVHSSSRTPPRCARPPSWQATRLRMSIRIPLSSRPPRRANRRIRRASQLRGTVTPRTTRWIRKS